MGINYPDRQDLFDCSASGAKWADDVQITHKILMKTHQSFIANCLNRGIKMQLEYHVNKPTSLRGYPLHRMVMGLTDGKSALFVDEGRRLVLRTDANVDAPVINAVFILDSEAFKHVVGDLFDKWIKAEKPKRPFSCARIEHFTVASFKACHNRVPAHQPLDSLFVGFAVGQL